MDKNSKKQTIIGNIAVATLLFSALFLLYCWSSSSFTFPNQFFLPSNQSLCTKSTAIDGHKAQHDNIELDSALAKASTENKTVIIAIVNKAYVEQEEDNVDGESTMLNIFLRSFWLGEGTRSLVDNLLIVAVDKTAYDRCRFMRLNCFRLETDGVDFGGEKLYMSNDFIKMMWTRTRFLLDVLKRGYNFIFTDTDVVWLRNPFTKLSNNETEDLQISTDHFNGNSWSPEIQLINTGFYFARSNNKTISLFETWYAKKDNSTGMKEQDVLLNMIRNEGIIGKLGLRVRFLDTLYFSGFCQDSKDFRQVTTVHANCCRSIFAKVKDLKAVLRDWMQFKRLEESNNSMVNNMKWSVHGHCWHSWKISNNTKG
ncbi:hypothetical protein HN51_053898 [Arachis hypogaea]|nr:hypothetical protein Ahy_B09g095328 [Arachis hypogaea]